MEDFSKWFHKILEDAEIIDSRYPIKGMSVWLPNGFKLRKYVIKVLKELLDNDHDEVLFPLLIPEEELMKEAIHVKGFEEEVYWVTHGGLTELNNKLALRPTSETSMYPMFKLWVRSHIDLPMKYYQVVNTFRYETKHTRPLIRVREITTFKEAHTVHSTYADAENQVCIAINIYKSFFDMLGIPYIINKRPNWDKFPGADYTMAFDVLMPDGKVLQVGTVHNLGQTFAKTFDIQFENQDGANEYAYQTCYGLSERVIASIIGVHGDDSGLCLPTHVAPYQIVIVPIIFKDKADEVISVCDKLENELKKKYRVYCDDRDLRPGKKFFEWETKGVPIRIEVGPKDLENNWIVVFRRDLKKKINVSLDSDLLSEIGDIIKDIDNSIKEKAEINLQNNINEAKDLESIANLNHNPDGILTFPWCGEEDCGKSIEEKTNIDLLGIIDEVEGICIHCDKKAKFLASVAKTY